jgi:uncharacterized protein YqgC (DUF456 family)
LNNDKQPHHQVQHPDEDKEFAMALVCYITPALNSMTVMNLTFFASYDLQNALSKCVLYVVGHILLAVHFIRVCLMPNQHANSVLTAGSVSFKTAVFFGSITQYLGRIIRSVSIVKIISDFEIENYTK